MSGGIALLLGLVQGLTEFLPVSSSGHLILIPYLLGWGEVPHPLIFDVMLHVATLLAVGVYFRHDLCSLFASLGRKAAAGTATGEERGRRQPRTARADPESYASNSPHSEDPLQGQGRKVLLGIAISLLPLPLVALTWGDWLEGMAQRPQVVALAMLFTGVLCWAVDQLADRTCKRWAGMTVVDAVWMGLAQAAATTQGISRSGSTIAMGLMRGLEREVAARFSFLMSIPAILGASLWEARRIDTAAGVGWSAYLIGMGVAFLSGYAALVILFRVLRQGRFRVFAFYCWALAGSALLKWLLTGN